MNCIINEIKDKYPELKCENCKYAVKEEYIDSDDEIRCRRYDVYMNENSFCSFIDFNANE